MKTGRKMNGAKVQENTVASAGEAGGPGDKISLLFFSERAGGDLGMIDLTEAEWKAVQADATARGETLAAWLARTLEQALAESVKGAKR